MIVRLKSNNWDENWIMQFDLSEICKECGKSVTESYFDPKTKKEVKKQNDLASDFTG